MRTYYISGVWKDENNIITDYAVHTVNLDSITRARKYSKTQAINLVETANVEVYTWLWNYSSCRFVRGEKVTVIETYPNKYLRSNPDNKLTDNLGHLINFAYFFT